MKLAATLFLLLSTASALALNEKPIQPPAPIEPGKPVTVTLPVQDWQAVLASVSDSARVSARDAGRINQTIISQVQPQIAPQPPPKK